MNLSQQFLIIFFIGSIFGCQSDQSTQDQRTENIIQAQFYLRYLKPERTLQTEVSFRETNEGKQFPVKMETATFEGEEMQQRNLLQQANLIRYDAQRRGPYREEYHYQFKHPQLGIIGQTLSFNPVSNPSIVEDQISIARGFTIRWEGAPLTSEQQLIMLFDNPGSRGLTVQIDGPSMGNEVFIPADKIKSLQAGVTQLSLIHKQISREQQDRLDVVSEMEYYSDTFPTSTVP